MTLPTAAPMSLRLDADLRERLNKIADVQKRSAHALARDAVSRYVAQEEKGAQWNASCQASLDEYKETGLHITHEELNSWLDTWGTTNEKPAPECHE
jgi:predicted transcriptional regulator